MPRFLGLSLVLLFLTSSAFGAGREIGVVRPELPANTGRSAVATNGSGFLAAWAVVGTREVTVHAAALDGDGNRGADATIAMAAGAVSALRVFAIGDAYTVIWADVKGVHASRVSDNGNLLQETVADSSPSAFLAATDGGTRIAIAQQGDLTGVRIVVFDPTEGGRQELNLANCGKPTDLAFVGNALVLTSVSGELCVRWIPLDGAAPITTRLPGVSAAAAVISAGDDALIVWSPAGRTVRAAILRRDGFAADPIDIVDAAAGLDHITMARLTRDGEDFLLTFGANAGPNQNQATASYAMALDSAGRTRHAPVLVIGGYPASIDAAVAADRAVLVMSVAPPSPYTLGTAIDLRNDFHILRRNLIAMERVRPQDIPQGSISVASNGFDFLTTFRERHYPYYSMGAATIGYDGSPLGVTELVPDGFTLSSSGSLAFAANVYLQVAGDNGSKLLRRFTANGVPIDAQPLVIAGEGYSLPVVATDGRNFLVVWTGNDGRSIRAAVVTPGGDVGAVRTIVTGPAKRRVGNPQVASDGSRFVITYEISREPLSTHDFDTFLTLHAIATTADGATGPSITIPGANGYSERIASSGRDFLIVGRAPEGVIGWPVTVDGLSLQTPYPRLYARVGDYAFPGVAWNGGEYVIAFRHMALSLETFLGVTRVRNGMPGEVVSTPTGRSPSESIEAPVIAVNALGTELILVNEARDRISNNGHVVAYLGSEITEHVERPRAPLITSARHAGDHVTLTWDRTSANERGFYLYAEYAWGSYGPIFIPAGATTFNFFEARVETATTFKLYAWNAAGMSPASNAYTLFPSRRAIGRR